MDKIVTRYGDGTLVEMTETQLMEDLIAGIQDAADRGRIDAVTQDELDHMADIFKCTHRVVVWIQGLNAY
jgi:dimethylamine--corrinoid protein Co-methyltransferase